MRCIRFINGLACLVIAAMSSHAPAHDDPREKGSYLGRRIGVDGHGKLEVSRTNGKHRAIFAGGGQDWHLKLKGDKWLIVPSRNEAGQKQLFLSFCLEKPTNAGAEMVTLSEEFDERCLWNLEFEEPIPKVSTRWCVASPTAGTFRGWFLAAGDLIEPKNGGVLSRSITLQKEKSTKTRLRISEDGR